MQSSMHELAFQLYRKNITILLSYKEVIKELGAKKCGENEYRVWQEINF